jgi:hypothetical protein
VEHVCVLAAFFPFRNDAVCGVWINFRVTVSFFTSDFFFT